MNPDDIATLARSAYYRLPHDLRTAILVRVRAGRLWKRTGVVFIHIPKAAGTSFSYALYGRSAAHARASDVQKWGSPAIKALPSFAVTRNPWDRLVSAYRFAKRGRGLGGAVQAWVWQPQQYDIPEFETFERFVNDWLAMRDPRTLDGIFQPQSLFVCGDTGEALVDHVGRLDDLEPTFRFLERTIGSTPCLARANSSGGPVNYRTFYTTKLVDTVGEIYRDDVQKFGYSY